MKKILFSLSMCVLSCLAANAKTGFTADGIKNMVETKASTPEVLSMEYAYCSDNIAQGVGENAKELYFKAAIQLPAEKATALKGNSITEVSIGTSKHVGHHAKLFLTYELGGEPFYTQDIQLVKNKWNTVKLTTPYTIEGKEFYIGYSADTIGSYRKVYLPIAIDDSNTANPLGDWVMTKTSADADEVWQHLGTSGYSNVCIKAVVTGANLPRYDVELASVRMKKYVKPGESFSIRGTVKNLAAKPFQKISVSYTIGDGETVSQDFASDNEIGNKQEFSFEIPGVYVNKESSYDVSVQVTAIDGNADENPADNVYTAQLKCTSKLFDKRVLVENFTTQSCGNCPRVHGYIEDLMDKDDRLVCVAHHAGYGTDKFTVKASESYLWFYNSNSSYAPAVMLDRKNFSGYGLESNTPVFNPSSEQYLATMIGVRENEPAFFDVNLENEYDAATRELTVHVKGKKSSEFTGDKPLYLTVFLTEDGLAGNQSGATKDYVHDHVLRLLVSKLTGDPIAFDSDNKCEKTYKVTLDNGWVKDNMKVVAFVNEFDTNDVNACEVYNVNVANLNDATSSIISNNIADFAVRVFDRTVSVSGSFDNASVYRADGSHVLSTSKPTFQLVPGVYVVKVKAAGMQKAAKVVIR